MVRNKQQRSYTHEAAVARMDWFKSSDASADAVADWDIKQELLSASVLGVLGMGSAIMFGVSLSGEAVSVTVYSGENKHRKWVTDSVELEDYLTHIVNQLRTARAGDISHGLRAVGD